jgi:lariat debranching enzyme
LLTQVIDIPTSSSTQSENGTSSAEVDFTFDSEWLAILRAFHPLLSTTRFQQPFPPEDVARAMVSESLTWVQENVPDLSVNAIQKFVMTAPGPSEEENKLVQRAHFLDVIMHDLLIYFFSQRQHTPTLKRWPFVRC